MCPTPRDRRPIGLVGRKQPSQISLFLLTPLALPCTYPTPTLHLPCTYPTLTLHLPYTHLPYTYPAPTLHLPCTYPAPTLHLPYIYPTLTLLFFGLIMFLCDIRFNDSCAEFGWSSWHLNCAGFLLSCNQLVDPVHPSFSRQTPTSDWRGKSNVILVLGSFRKAIVFLHVDTSLAAARMASALLVIDGDAESISVSKSWICAKNQQSVSPNPPRATLHLPCTYPVQGPRPTLTHCGL